MRLAPGHKVYALGALLGVALVYASEAGLLGVWLSFGTPARSKAALTEAQS